MGAKLKGLAGPPPFFSSLAGDSFSTIVSKGTCFFLLVLTL